MTTGQNDEIKVSPNGHKQEPFGVRKLPGQKNLAQEYITPGKDFQDALARTTIQDPNFLNNVVQLYGQMMEFNENHLFDDAINELTLLLIGKNALGGYNRSLSAMVGTGIYYPEGAGIKMSKEDKKNYMEAQRLKFSSKNQNKEGSEED
ncbi:MAG: hypothetical protein PHG35_01965 [Dehalococcoidales bacterium]|nr:hypothetical protein [Dehalococcoidales bacterium]